MRGATGCMFWTHIYEIDGRRTCAARQDSGSRGQGDSSESGRGTRTVSSRHSLASRQEREARGLTWYALAKLAGIPNQATIRSIEQGKDVKLSNLQSIADVLGLTLELVRKAG